MTPEDIVFTPVVLPLLGAALVIFAKAFFTHRALRAIEYAAVVIGLGLPCISFIYTLPVLSSGQVVEGVIGNWHAAVGITFRFDGLAWLVNILIYSVCCAAWCYSLGAGPRGAAFTSVFLILTASLSAAMMTTDIFNLFVCLEVTGIASYILVASSDKPGASLASFKYLMISASAMVFFLLGVYGLYRLTGALSYQGIIEGLKVLPDAGGAAAVISLALIISSTAVRVAVMPLSSWLPDAHALSPHAVSAVLSGVLIKIPLFALTRVLMLMPAGASAGELLAWCGGVTAVLGVILAISQKDAKRLLACHSISQIGYVVCAWGAAMHIGPSTPAGIILVSSAFLHGLYHALFKGLLFLSIGTVIDRSGERNVYVLRGAGRILKAAGERIPVTLITYFAGALAISAVPPFSGFISKQAISSALQGSPLYYLLFAAGIGTAASFIKLSRIFIPAGPQPEILKQAIPVPLTSKVSQFFLALLCLAGGIAASPVYSSVLQLLSGNTLQYHTAWYTPASLYKALITIAAGAGLFFLTSLKPLQGTLKRIRERQTGFQGIYVSFSLGTAVLAVWMLLR